jgi:hypothetical protein
VKNLILKLKNITTGTVRKIRKINIKKEKINY